MHAEEGTGDLARLPSILAGFRAEDVPGRFAAEVKLTLLDTIAAALAATREPGSLELLHRLSEHAAGKSPIWWTGRTAALPEAIFANALSVHLLDFDSVHYATLGHPAVVLFPPLLAAAEAASLPVRRVIPAFVLGLETMAILADAFGELLRERGLHPTSVLGAIAAAAAAAWLLGAPAAELARAMNLCSATASGFTSSFGSQAKAYQVATAARNGHLTAAHARAGVVADEGSMWMDNLCLLSGGAPGRARSIARPWVLDEYPMSFKRYPCCAYFEQVLGAARAARSVPGWNPSAIRRVTVTGPAYMRSASRFANPTTPDQRRFSLPYNLALVLASGELHPRDFAIDRLTDPRLGHLCSLIEIACAPQLASGQAASVSLCIEDDRGHRVHELAVVPSKSTDDARVLVEDKLRSAADGLWASDRVEWWIRAIDDLESLDLTDLALLGARDGGGEHRPRGRR